MSEVAAILQLHDLDLMMSEMRDRKSIARLKKLGFGLDSLAALERGRAKLLGAIDRRWLNHYERAIREWQQAGAWTPLWVTLRTLVELLARAGAWADAATLYGAVTSASSGAPPFGADADRLRQSAALLHQHLTGTELRFHAGKGEQMDGGQVIQFALQAIGSLRTGGI